MLVSISHPSHTARNMQARLCPWLQLLSKTCIYTYLSFWWRRRQTILTDYTRQVFFSTQVKLQSFCHVIRAQNLGTVHEQKALTKSIDVVKDCHYLFGAVFPSVLVLRKADKLALRYQCLENVFCTLLSLYLEFRYCCVNTFRYVLFTVFFPVFVSLYLSTAWWIKLIKA